MSALDLAFHISFINFALDDHHHTGQLAIDKVAATRFIKHAIAQVKDTTPNNVPGPSAHVRPNDNNNDTGGGAASRNVRVPLKVTEKMLEREKYYEALREEDLASDDDGGLEVIDDEEDGPSNGTEAGRTPSEEDAFPPLRESKSDATSSKEKGKGKAKAVVDGTSTPLPDDPPPSETNAEKRRRPPMDPFAGLYCFRFVASSYPTFFPLRRLRRWSRCTLCSTR